MSKKKCLKSKTKRSGKESKNTVNQRNKEMIDEYELCIRSAITGNKKYFFIAYLMYKRQNDLCESYKSFCFISNLLTQNDMYILN